MTGLIDNYGVLELNETKYFTVESNWNLEVQFFSFQGPIKFARVDQDGNFIELKPLPGTYLFTDLVISNPRIQIKYACYGSEGGATFPQYRFSERHFYGVSSFLITAEKDQHLTSIMTYKNSSVQYRLENEYLILEIPMIVRRNGTFILGESFLVNIGHEKDKELLKLGYYAIEIEDKLQNFKQSRYNTMTFLNYYTTVYIKINPNDNYNYFAVICESSNLPLGGSTFVMNYPASDYKRFVPILITFILVLLITAYRWRLTKSKQNWKQEEGKEKLSQSYQQFN
ncbi:unnamed protein product (macronuclear) [Paramecium tetraurelia]|uniref:ER membrane protein complex subunit 7 beta-sandwich domain-containing protein n=1 Tax=Paramecium tetraurelia TaxID=5888 RepID=A0E9S1_PARTE|nr:uncharacterized protein GSPATT00024769001 [Paramecium tetraurelia]CAK92038.1 unnamed protein product [Paramecium tetraurelia]|eukprot:XP_001459435.1 hypothetical protein (macronuclear) [Paramecium tetraurelia strain d4-2]